MTRIDETSPASSGPVYQISALSDVGRVAFAMDAGPELPGTEPVVTTRHRETALDGFDPATGRQGRCDPAIA